MSDTGSIPVRCPETMAHKDPEKQRDYSRKWYLKNRDRILANHKTNPTRKIYHRKDYLKHKYGMTEDDYNRLLVVQRGCCKICGGPPGNKKSPRFHIDHDHQTGKVRGLLCQKCNHLLGMANDEPIILRLAALYLEKHNNG